MIFLIDWREGSLLQAVFDSCLEYVINAFNRVIIDSDEVTSDLGELDLHLGVRNVGDSLLGEFEVNPTRFLRVRVVSDRTEFEVGLEQRIERDGSKGSDDVLLWDRSEGNLFARCGGCSCHWVSDCSLEPVYRLHKDIGDESVQLDALVPLCVEKRLGSQSEVVSSRSGHQSLFRTNNVRSRVGWSR